MNEILPQTYLIGLIVLLGGAAVVVARQILRVRSDEVTLARLEGARDKDQVQDSASLYELASVQLRKRLFGQASDNLKRALQRASEEGAPREAQALIQNALGFSLAAQSNYQAAIRHYRSAVKAKPDYAVALNNLAFALEKQGKPEDAMATYGKVLALDPANATARKRLNTLERRSGTSPETADRRR
jgi:tetratricopeptide (TPR) repeat protein